MEGAKTTTMEKTLVSRKRKQTEIQDIVSAKKFYTSSTPKKDSSMMQDKEDSVSLSSYKFVYARTEDPADTIVLRSISPDCLESLQCYGTKGKENIKHMFLAVLKLIGTTSAEEILLKTKYLTYLQINACFELANEMKEDIDDMEFETTIKESSNSNIFTYVQLPNMDRVGITTTKFPQICFLSNTENEQRTGIFLFFNEILKLLKYVNSKFEFAQHKFFVNRKQNPCNFKDDFF